MRLCFLVRADSIHSFRWIRYFAQKGHEVHWISLVPSSFPYLKNATFHLLKENFSSPRWSVFKSFSVFFNIAPLKKILKEIQPDILHAQYMGVSGILGALSGFHPLVLSVWGEDLALRKKYFWKRPALRFALRKANLLICNADYIQKEIVRLGVSSSLIKFIDFGVDTVQFSPGERNENLLEKLGTAGSPVVVSTRNWESLYNIESLIRAVPLVLLQNPRTKFMIIGRGKREKNIKRLAKALGVSKNILFVGYVSNEELPQYLRLADAYVSTALFDESLAASTAEAMSCGLPVVVTDAVDNRSWIEDGQNGFVVPLKNPKILAERIVKLLGDERLRSRFGKINRELILKRDDYQTEMGDMESLYNLLIHKR